MNLKLENDCLYVNELPSNPEIYFVKYLTTLLNQCEKLPLKIVFRKTDFEIIAPLFISYQDYKGIPIIWE